MCASLLVGGMRLSILVGVYCSDKYPVLLELALSSSRMLNCVAAFAGLVLSLSIRGPGCRWRLLPDFVMTSKAAVRIVWRMLGRMILFVSLQGSSRVVDYVL